MIKTSQAIWLWIGIFIVAAMIGGCDKKENTPPINDDITKTETETIIKEPTMPDVSTRIKIETSKGDIVVELDEKAAPITTTNFLSYIEAGFFDGTIFHRVISGFMIQGGGMTADMGQKQTKPPIVNEANNGLKNDRGTIAMARTNDPDSATAQFFINHKDNDFLNYSGPRNPGYAVFGKTVDGMDVVDAIAEVKTKPGDIPVETVLIKSIKILAE